MPDTPESWDPGETGAMSETEWRNKVVGRVNSLHYDLTTNTAATMATSRRVEELAGKIKPVTDFSEKVQKGFEVIGWLGSGAEWLVKRWFYVALVAIAAKVLLSGGTWAEVRKLFEMVPPVP